MPRPNTTARCRFFTPPATSTANTTMASTMAEPRSGSFMTERGAEREHQHHRAHDAPPVVDLAGAPAHEVGGVQQEGELGDLARLEAEHAHAEPTPRSRHVDPDAGDQHDDEQDHADDEQRADQARHLR